MMDYSNLKNKLIESGLFRSDGTIKPQWIQNYKINPIPELEEVPGDTVQEKLYVIFKNNGEQDKCVICGNPSLFNSYSRGYNKTCSIECKHKLDTQVLDKSKDKRNSEEIKEKRRQTCLAKYGVDNPRKAESIKEKAKQTSLAKYGTSNPASSQIIKDKIKQSFLEKYGVDNISRLDSVKKKLSEINSVKFAPRAPIWDQIRQTNIEKYGFDNPAKNEDVKNKIKETNIERYGVENPSQNKKIIEKMRNTNLKKYGASCYLRSEEDINKTLESNLEKYGFLYPQQNPEIKKKILSHKGKTGSEKKFEEFLINRGFKYQYEYDINGKNFDFAIFKDEELSILVEIDGEYNHGLKSDPDDHLVKGFTDCERFLKVPAGVKFIDVDSQRIEEAFAEVLRVFNIDYESWIREIIDNLPKDFPFYNYDEKRLRSDYKNLCNYKDLSNRSRLADSTIQHFHKSIYTAHVGNKPSPYEAWHNPKLLEKCVRNRFIYSSSLSSHSILNGFNVCKIAPKVSVFSASLAKIIISKYLNDFNEIFDPFSGFSGRMLGACSLGKKYIGQDINQIHINESNEIIKFHNLNAEVICKDIFDSEGEYECLFTCSPYNLKETWDNENQVNYSCDQWIDECLKRFKCKRYVFVVNETEKYKNYIAEGLSNKSHFSKANEYVIVI